MTDKHRVRIDASNIQERVDEIYRTQSRRVFATLVRLIGDFDLAEESLHEAFAAAIEQWPTEGIPANPRAWLVSTGRFKAIDTIRRRTRFDSSVAEIARTMDADNSPLEDLDEAQFRDDQLRLIFTCCHPVLPHSTQVALTLREVCGLTTEEIGRAFLTSAPTIAQRIVRGKARIREKNIPYEVPSIADLPERLDSVLAVIYLVFNEGYAASAGEQVTRHDLSAEAIRLGQILQELQPDPEVFGLLALMVLHDARRAARVATDGDIILLEDQDRSLWNREQIASGIALVEQALTSRRFGVYTLQAAIAAVHAEAPCSEQTDWAQIIALYDLLLRASNSPVVELNRAVAVAMHDGPQVGLAQIDEILARGELTDYHLSHAARADMCRRLGRRAEAAAAYQRALDLAEQLPERRFLQRRLNEMGGGAVPAS